MAVRRPGRKTRKAVAEGDSRGQNPSVVGGETHEISDSYFDTDDWRIYRAGYALRIRREDGNKAEATMKRLDSENGRPGIRSAGRSPSLSTARTPRP